MEYHSLTPTSNLPIEGCICADCQQARGLKPLPARTTPALPEIRSSEWVDELERAWQQKIDILDTQKAPAEWDLANRYRLACCLQELRNARRSASTAGSEARPEL